MRIVIPAHDRSVRGQVAAGIRALLAAALSFAALAAPPLPLAKTPEEVGLSSAQLARLEAATRANVAVGVPAGAVMLVARDGKIAFYKALGDRDREAHDPMRTDAIFRLYSMTKPIVSVAIMQLVEEGRLQIADPVSMYLPEMKGMKVGLEKVNVSGRPTLELVEPEREMTIQDLLRHTSGLIYPGGYETNEVNKAYNAAGLLVRDVDSREFVTRLAKMPLRFSPGTRWEYGVSTDVLGRVLEVIEKRSLAEILHSRILVPLRMVDTAFFVSPEKSNRVARPWQRPNGPLPVQFDSSVKPAFESGGAGLLGTAEDYLRFCQMLLNGGELDGTRILGRKSVEYMTADHVGDIPGRPPGAGFGLGFEVRMSVGRFTSPGSAGEYGWAGSAGTFFRIDPRERLVMIYMSQVADVDRFFLRNQFRDMVEAAIIK